MIALAAAGGSFPASLAMAQSATDFAASDTLVHVAHGAIGLLDIGPPGFDAVVRFEPGAKGRFTLDPDFVDPSANPAVTPETVAVLRGRRDDDGGAPSLADRTFAEAIGMPVFVRNASGASSTLWEIGRQRGVMVFRVIDSRGKAGGWTPWP